MRLRVLLCGLLLLLASYETSMAMLIGEYNARRNEIVIKFYIAGVGAGYYYAMNVAGALKKPKLYCPKQGPDVLGENYMNILDAAILAEGPNIHPDISVEVILLRALMALFPCP